MGSFFIIAIPVVSVWLSILWTMDFIKAVRREGLWKVITVKRLFMTAAVFLACSAVAGFISELLSGKGNHATKGGSSTFSADMWEWCVIFYMLCIASASLACMKRWIEILMKHLR